MVWLALGICPLCAAFGLDLSPGTQNFASNLDVAFSPFDLTNAAAVTVNDTDPGSLATWTLYIKADSEFASVADPSITASAAQLSYRVNGGSYSNLTTANVQIASGTPGTFAYTLDYRLAIDLSLTAMSDYRTTVVYTLIGI